MTREQFKAQIEESGIPVFYDHADIGTKVPFITYTWDYDNFGADDKVHAQIVAVTVTHYHADYDDGSTLKTLFDENDIFWNVDTAYDSDMRLYIDTYTMEVLEDAED